MRQLGLNTTSAGAIRTVRRRADELGLDSSHFRGMRRWSDQQLRDAISSLGTWDEVVAALGLSANSGNIRSFIKSHAMRLGLDCGHLASRAPSQFLAAGSPIRADADLKHLRYAASSLAAAWFTLCGHTVTFPIEPATFDLLVSTPLGIRRIQVKTTTSQREHGWEATVGHRPYTTDDLGPLSPYDPADIDFFFIVDGDLEMYLIPASVIAGRVSILLTAYKDYAVGGAGALMVGPAVTSVA